jgi:hypothetical protein
MCFSTSSMDWCLLRLIFKKTLPLSVALMYTSDSNRDESCWHSSNLVSPYISMNSLDCIHRNTMKGTQNWYVVNLKWECPLFLCLPKLLRIMKNLTTSDEKPLIGLWINGGETESNLTQSRNPFVMWIIYIYIYIYIYIQLWTRFFFFIYTRIWYQWKETCLAIPCSFKRN